MDGRSGAVVRPDDTIEKLLANPFELGATIVAEECHPVQAVIPRLDHAGACRSVERELLVRKGQGPDHATTGLSQVVRQLPPHAKVISLRCRCVLDVDGK